MLIRTLPNSYFSRFLFFNRISLFHFDPLLFQIFYSIQSMHLMVRFIISFYNVRVPFFLLFYSAFLVHFFYIYIFYLLSSYGCSALYFLSLVSSCTWNIFYSLLGSTLPLSLLVSIFSIFCTFYSFFVSFSFSSQVFWTFYLFFLNESSYLVLFRNSASDLRRKSFIFLNFFEILICF